jgi:hypothetical protein
MRVPHLSINGRWCSRPICDSCGTALAQAALLRLAALQRFLSLPRYAQPHHPRGQRLRAPPSGYGFSALHNPRNGAGNPSRQFQPQQSRSACAVCGRKASDASRAGPGELREEDWVLPPSPSCSQGPMAGA